MTGPGSKEMLRGGGIEPKHLPWLGRHGVWPVLLVAAACYALSFNPRLSGTDDATYLVAAKALAAGQGFCKANLAGCPPETYYPPGFPLLLAPLVAILPGWPQNVPLLMAVPMGFALLSLAVVHRLLRREWGSWRLPLLIALALAVSYVGAWFTFVLMSETLYLFLSAAALLLLGKAEAGDKPLPLYAAAGLLAGAAAGVRTAGLALVGGALAYLLLHRRWKPAMIVAAAAGLLVLPVLARAYAVTHSPAWTEYRGVFINSYADTFLQKHWQDTTLGRATLTDLARRLPTNIRGHATDSLPKLLLPTLQSYRLEALLQPLQLGWVLPACGWAMAAAAAAGLGLRLRRRWGPVELYVLLYLVLILLPGWYTFRNLLPIVPFLYLYLATFLVAALGWAARLAGRGCLAGRLGPAMAGLLVLLSALSNSLSMAGTNFEMGAQYRAAGTPYVEEASFFEACGWIREHTEADALVAYRSAEKMYLCSGRQAPPSLSTMPVSLDGRDHGAVIQAVYRDADFVVVTATDVADPPLTDSEPVDFQSTAFLHPVLAGDPGAFALRYETAQPPTVRIYEVRR